MGGIILTFEEGEDRKFFGINVRTDASRAMAITSTNPNLPSKIKEMIDWAFKKQDHIGAIILHSFKNYDKDKNYKYTKVKIKKISKEKVYTLIQDKTFGFSGIYLSEIEKYFGDQYQLFFPNCPVPCYAVSGDKYIIVSPFFSIEDIENLEIVEEDKQLSFDEVDDLW
jgi:hypothetical protein